VRSGCLLCCSPQITGGLGGRGSDACGSDRRTEEGEGECSFQNCVRQHCYPTSVLDDAERLKDRSDVARPVWSVTTHQGKLTARRLVITFVPMRRDGVRAAATCRLPRPIFRPSPNRPNGEINAASEAYETKASAEKGIAALKTHALTAKVEDQSET
jgi:Domain of unknown function (DUF1508)